MRSYYLNTIAGFIEDDREKIVGALTLNSQFDADLSQISAWKEQIEILKSQLEALSGKIFLEFSIPRMGKRVDVIVVVDDVVFVIEFKVGEKVFKQSAKDQVCDYALDLKNFHQTSHSAKIVPILVATKADHTYFSINQTIHADGISETVCINALQLRDVINRVLASDNPASISEWENGSYLPTPTIVEAALALYSGHSVDNILQKGAANLSATVNALQSVINDSLKHKRKAICFVTGVPGAGKTLVGLDVAVQNISRTSDVYSVYLSGNGPLVRVLQEALAIDQVHRAKENSKKLKKGEARSRVKLFIQNIHHFRDECVAADGTPPLEHVVIFDESQRAWNQAMTSDFMQRKKNIPGFNMSEPEYLISCMDRHKDWAVIVCLVGGGQEINRGEAGIAEWIHSVQRSFPQWSIFCSKHLVGNNYISHDEYQKASSLLDIREIENLHLATSMRSFKASQVADMVNSLLSRNLDVTKDLYAGIKDRYPIVITRSVEKGRSWLRKMARGTERFGMAVSSKAYRLRPHAVDARNQIDPIHWFLADKDDVRSSYYLEDVATEFQIQGLELDWVCVTWDADLRLNRNQWAHFNFVGNKWQQVNKEENQKYLENAYRVLMTRARQGMVLVVPEGSSIDATRDSKFYDPTYNYLKSIGFPELQ